ncbi:polyphosphate kinase 1 [Aurantivibrio infirmus]
MSKDNEFIAKELSWLSFNERVLQEASDKNVPVIQRLRYLGIFSNNLDEFFRVRVADVSRLAAFSAKSGLKEKYNQLLLDIQARALQLQNKFDRVYLNVLADLRKKRIYLVNEEQLDQHQAAYVEQLFDTQVLPELDPILLHSPQSFPPLVDGLIYLAVKICSGDQVSYGIVEVPTDRIHRFNRIPSRKGKKGKVFIVLDNIIRHCLPKVFRGVIDIDSVEAYTFKLTMDAELELGDGINQSLVNRLATSLKKRQNSDNLERFIYDSMMPQDLLDLLTRRLNLDKYDSLMPGGRYHNAKDFIDFPNDGPAYLEFKPLSKVPSADLDDEDKNIFESIRNRDVLLYYPYNAFDSVIELLKTAAIDPAVKKIQISLYRVASKSRVVDALLSARGNDKEVTAVVELQARFDEAANIDWATQLTEGGVNVIFGIPGLKVHSKLILITRQENNTLRYYTHIGTGNFNEKTSKVYTDFSLLTYDQKIGKDTDNVFDFISYTYRRHHYEQLLVSPLSNRLGVEKLITNEIDNAKAYKIATITIKCNNLVDPSIIELLYQASNHGVRVRVICRGMCSLVPGIPGMSENIEVISIVDRFLEHARVFIFHNDGKPKYFISSADLMTRNLDFRVEVTVPIKDQHLQARIQDIIDIQWCDNVKARSLDAKLSNDLRKIKMNGNVRSQEVIHEYFEKGKLPQAVQRARARWEKDLKSAIKRKSKKKKVTK